MVEDKFIFMNFILQNKKKQTKIHTSTQKTYKHLQINIKYI